MDANPASWAKILKRIMKHHWQPEPVSTPLVDEDLPHLSGIERAAEVLRFMLTKLEHWLSPKGNLREFMKFNFRLAITIAIPLLLVAPLITTALNQLMLWIVLLTQTFSSFILFPLSVILSILLVCGMIYIGRTILDMRLRSQRDHRRENYY